MFDHCINGNFVWHAMIVTEISNVINWPSGKSKTKSVRKNV